MIMQSEDPTKELNLDISEISPMKYLSLTGKSVLSNSYLHNGPYTIFEYKGSLYEFLNPINQSILQINNLILLSFSVMLIGFFMILRYFNKAYMEPINYMKELVHREVYNLFTDKPLDLTRESREMYELIRAVHEVVGELKERNKILLNQSRDFQKKSFTDGLTGLNNRAALNRLLQEDDLWQQPTKPVSFLLLDIDFFKQYNDTYGHISGDEALQQVASVFEEIFVMPNDFWARYGGEEFAILLQNTSLGIALKAAERLRIKIEEKQIPHATSKVSNWLTVSIGIASTIPGSFTDTDHLLETADEALYQAKRLGRNCVSALYPPSKISGEEELTELKEA